MLGWKKLVPKGSSTTRKCDLFGVGIVLEEVRHYGGSLEDLICLRYHPIFQTTFYFQLDVVVSAQYLYIYAPIFHQDDYGPNFKWATPIKCFALEELPWSWWLYTATETLPKTEVCARDWDIFLIHLIMFLLGRIWTLVLWVRKVV